MLLKRICIFLLCGVIFVGLVDYSVTFRFFDRPLTKEKQEEFQERIELPKNFTLAASVNSIDTVKNTLRAAQKNVRGGSYALELNVTINTKGVPYLADGPGYITGSSVQLETIFKTFAEMDYIRYILNLKNLISPDVLVDLATRYSLFGRIMLAGFSPDDLAKVSPGYGNFMLCADLDPQTLNFSSKRACDAVLTQCSDYGACAVSCSLDQITDTFREALYSYNQLRLIIRDVHSDYSMYHALSLNPNIVITDRPDLLYQLMLSQNYLDLNTNNTF